MKDAMGLCNRSELRICKEVAVFVETHSSPAGDARSPNIIVSKTVDISANGLQIVMDKPAAPGSILQVCVEFTGHPTHYHLTGEVKWVAKIGRENDFLVGFLLLESDQTDIEIWKHRVAMLMEDPANQVH
ncbi:MAG TPA: PilZ domain-containing protein [Pseudomonadales bacterium]|nr:PilZ domain-containing protein [Pseudomonadales bacterium]